jgi:metal-dependent hydrolase (beta-lactamase superfamily II)
VVGGADKVAVVITGVVVDVGILDVVRGAEVVVVVDVVGGAEVVVVDAGVVDVVGGTHLTEPGEDAVAHTVQLDAPGTGLYVPTAHCTHSVKPDDENVPAGQGMHVGPVEYEPALQVV